MSHFPRNGVFDRGIVPPMTPARGISYNSARNDWASMKEDWRKYGSDNSYLTSIGAPSIQSNLSFFSSQSGIRFNQTQSPGIFAFSGFPNLHRKRANPGHWRHQQNLTGKKSRRNFEQFSPNKRDRAKIKMDSPNSLKNSISNDKEDLASPSPPEKGAEVPSNTIVNKENGDSAAHSPSTSCSNSKASKEKAEAQEGKRIDMDEEKLKEGKDFSPITNLDDILTSGKSTPFQLVILFADSYEPMKDNDLYYVEHKLLSYVRKEIYKGGQVLRFEKTEHTKNGWLLITCADEDTVRWTLKKVIPEFSGNKFRIIRTRDLPKYFTTEIDFPTTSLDSKSMLEMLEQQNCGLKTHSWIVLNTRKSSKTDDSTIIEAKIPAAQLPILQKLQWKPYFEFSRASIKKCILEPEKKKFVKNKSLEPEPDFNDGDSKAKNQNDAEVEISTVGQREFDYRKIYGKNAKFVKGSVVAEVSLIDSDEGGDEPVKSSNSKSETQDVSSDADLEIVSDSAKSTNNVFSISDEENEKEEKEDLSEAGSYCSRASGESEFIMSDSDENESSELFNALRKIRKKGAGSSPKRKRASSVNIILSDSDSERDISVNRNPKRKLSSSASSKRNARLSHRYSSKRLRSEHLRKEEIDSNTVRNNSDEISSDVEIVEDIPAKNVIFISDEENQKEDTNDQASARKRCDLSLSTEVIDVEDDSSDRVLTEGEAFIVVSETEEDSTNRIAEEKSVPKDKDDVKNTNDKVVEKKAESPISKDITDAVPHEGSLRISEGNTVDKDKEVVENSNDKVVETKAKSPISKDITDAVPHEGSLSLCSEGDIPVQSSSEPGEKLFVVEGEALITVSETTEAAMHSRAKSQNKKLAGTEKRHNLRSSKDTSEPEIPDETASDQLAEEVCLGFSICGDPITSTDRRLQVKLVPKTEASLEKDEQVKDSEQTKAVFSRVKSESGGTEEPDDHCSPDEGSRPETHDETASSDCRQTRSATRRSARGKDLNLTADQLKQNVNVLSSSKRKSFQ